MVRKQIYIEAQQEAHLKRVARARGVSEAEVIRHAIDRQVLGRSWELRSGDAAAWKKALKVMRSLTTRRRRSGPAGAWTREEAYAERLSRHGRHPA